MPVHSQFIKDSKGNLSHLGLRQLGAFFPIEVHLPPQVVEAITKAGKPIPSCATGIGLIDTGATITCIHEEILKNLGANPIGIKEAGTAAGRSKCNVYPARIVFPTKGWTLDLKEAMGVDLTGQMVQTDPPQQIIALLGRNLLERGILIYNGVGGFWTITLETTLPIVS